MAFNKKMTKEEFLGIINKMRSIYKSYEKYSKLLENGYSVNMKNVSDCEMIFSNETKIRVVLDDSYYMKVLGLKNMDRFDEIKKNKINNQSVKTFLFDKSFIKAAVNLIEEKNWDYKDFIDEHLHFDNPVDTNQFFFRNIRIPTPEETLFVCHYEPKENKNSNYWNKEYIVGVKEYNNDVSLYRLINCTKTKKDINYIPEYMIKYSTTIPKDYVYDKLETIIDNQKINYLQFLNFNRDNSSYSCFASSDKIKDLISLSLKTGAIMETKITELDPIVFKMGLMKMGSLLD